MFALASLSLLLALVDGARCFGLHGFTYQGLKEPEVAEQDLSQDVRTGWIRQRLDHFNHRDNRTWSMRYMENSGFYNGSGAILIMLGGEWTITDGFLRAGLMYEIAQARGCAMYYTEHRYYGESRPTPDTSPENLQYLNVDQTLADVAYFVDAVRKRLRAPQETPVIVFGGSYAGNMAAWARIKYPHLVQAAVASSAPIFAKADFPEYYGTVTSALARHDANCPDAVKAAFDSVEGFFARQDGAELLKATFNLCEEPDLSSASDIGYFMNALAEKFASTVQYNDFVGDKTLIAAVCERIATDPSDPPHVRLARLVRPSSGCLDVRYKSFLATYGNESWDSLAGTTSTRQWLYQTCNEYGYYQTSDPTISVFGNRFKLDLYLGMCKDLYGDYYDEANLLRGVDRTNVMYGGLSPDVTKVVFTNGDIDPWHTLSVLRDLDVSSPAILIPGSSHCRDLYPDKATDGLELRAARRRVRRLVGRWARNDEQKATFADS